ncbi:MAG: hypothetical protein ACD_65C00364G0002 [uncultured bacterium]|nr:MAG: hypothetical protein ACD_65C00364G0002 [uncultured bacterium]OGJ48332.1 MAG: hypothetical protein A2244_02360 [Candidatus Peregrinibacteria bacterium RIFOXYA2_FULL_41_18]
MVLSMRSSDLSSSSEGLSDPLDRMLQKRAELYARAKDVESPDGNNPLWDAFIHNVTVQDHACPYIQFRGIFADIRSCVEQFAVKPQHSLDVLAKSLTDIWIYLGEIRERPFITGDSVTPQLGHRFWSPPQMHGGQPVPGSSILTDVFQHGHNFQYGAPPTVRTCPIWDFLKRASEGKTAMFEATVGNSNCWLQVVYKGGQTTLHLRQTQRGDPVEFEFFQNRLECLTPEWQDRNVLPAEGGIDISNADGGGNFFTYPAR